MEEFLNELTSEHSGSAILGQFDQDWSHTFRLGSRQRVEIDDLTSTLSELFREQVATVYATEKQELPLFQRQHLLEAGNALPLSPAIAAHAFALLLDPMVEFGKVEELIDTRSGHRSSIDCVTKLLSRLVDGQYRRYRKQ